MRGRLGSPSGRTPWTSCPVTWLFGVETGGRPRCPGEELWGLRWGGPVAESSRQSVQASTLRRGAGRPAARAVGGSRLFPGEDESTLSGPRGKSGPAWGPEPASRDSSSSASRFTQRAQRRASRWSGLFFQMHSSPSLSWSHPRPLASQGHRRKSRGLCGSQQQSTS